MFHFTIGEFEKLEDLSVPRQAHSILCDSISIIVGGVDIE